MPDGPAPTIATRPADGRRPILRTRLSATVAQLTGTGSPLGPGCGSAVAPAALRRARAAGRRRDPPDRRRRPDGRRGRCPGCRRRAASAISTGMSCSSYAASVAVRALGAEGLEQPGADLLPGHLDQTQAGDLGDLVPGPVPAEALDQPAQQQLAVVGQHHVDEVDHDDAADVAQPQLPDDLLGRLQVVAGHGGLEVAAGAGELAGVDVDHRHRLGAVDDQRAARGQEHLALQALGDLLVEPVRGEDVTVGLGIPAPQPVAPGAARRGRRRPRRRRTRRSSRRCRR